MQISGQVNPKRSQNDSLLDNSYEIEQEQISSQSNSQPVQDQDLMHLLTAQKHLQMAQAEYEKARTKLQAKGIKVFQMPEVRDFVPEDPYGQQMPLANLNRMNSSSKKSAGNFSNQKTPNGHPNTFLYRAHINLNELGSSVNQEDRPLAD